MISPIKTQLNNKPSFKGPLEVLTKGLELCDKYPMIGVSVIDTGTAIGPRTVVDLVSTNAYMAAETFRKESMGLLVNCLIPSFVVLGLAKMVQPMTMGKDFKGVDMASVWANEDTIKKLTECYKNTSGTSEQRVRQYAKAVLGNIEGFNSDSKNVWKSFSNVSEKASEDLADVILDNTLSKKETKIALGRIFDGLAEKTKATEVIRFSGDTKAFSSNLSDILRDTVDLGRRFQSKAVSSNLDEFAKRSIKLVNRKSLVGMAVLVPLAMSIQFINRAITKWHSGHDGAPIYKNFGKNKEIEIQKDRNNLGLNKFLASSLMVGTALATNTGKFTKKMFQFKGLFPTLNQCRWIATATIVSRILASDDNSELKETTIRDIATFLGLYALGDAVAKGVGLVIEKVKPNIKLLNRDVAKKAPKTFMQNMKAWFGGTRLKSFAEVSKAAKPYRSICQLAHLGSSMLVLGLAIPRYVRACTEKKEAKMEAIAKSQKEFQEQLKTMQQKSTFGAFKAYYKK